jgi:hypothetical protein
MEFFDHCLVVAKFRESPVVNTQRLHRFHMQWSNLKKINKAEHKEQYHVEVSNRFVALKDLYVEVRENIKTSAKKCLGYYEFKNKPWLNNGCSKLLDQRIKGYRIQEK